MSKHFFIGVAVAACLCLPGGTLSRAATVLELQNPDEGKPAPAPVKPGQPVRPVQPVQPVQPPAQQLQPQQPGTIVIVPTDPSASQITTPVVPQPQAPTVVIPQVPQVPQVPQPSQPQTQPETIVPETVITPVVPVTPVPVTPEVKPESVRPEPQPEQKVVPLLPVMPEPKQDPKAAPEPLNPGTFLLKSPEKTPESEKKPEPKKPDPQKPEPKKQEKTPPQKSEAKEPDKKTGDPLHVPEEAKKTGNLEFLEGCWVGTRPEYNSKRIVTERFCFDKSGVGKRYIEDPGIAGTCIGATKAKMLPGGVLEMNSEQMYCSDVSDNWGGSRMTCQGAGEQTPCTWVFDPFNKQSYTIRFVRE